MHSNFLISKYPKLLGNTGCKIEYTAVQRMKKETYSMQKTSNFQPAEVDWKQTKTWQRQKIMTNWFIS